MAERWDTGEQLLSEDGRVPVVAPDGSVALVPPGQLESAIREFGFRPATGEEWKKHYSEKKYGDDPTQAALAATEGALRAATFGGSDLLFRAGGVQDEVRQRAEHNPITSAAGEVAGFLTPGGIASKVGKGAIGAAKRVVPRVAEEGLARGTARAATAGALEAEAWNVGQGTISSVALSDKPINMELIAAEMGRHALDPTPLLLGAGVGTVAHAAIEGSRALRAKATTALNRLDAEAAVPADRLVPGPDLELAGTPQRPRGQMAPRSDTIPLGAQDIVEIPPAPRDGTIKLRASDLLPIEELPSSALRTERLGAAVDHTQLNPRDVVPDTAPGRPQPVVRPAPPAAPGSTQRMIGEVAELRARGDTIAGSPPAALEDDLFRARAQELADARRPPIARPEPGGTVVDELAPERIARPAPGGTVVDELRRPTVSDPAVVRLQSRGAALQREIAAGEAKLAKKQRDLDVLQNWDRHQQEGVANGLYQEIRPRPGYADHAVRREFKAAAALEQKLNVARGALERNALDLELMLGKQQAVTEGVAAKLERQVARDMNAGLDAPASPKQEKLAQQHAAEVQKEIQLEDASKAAAQGGVPFVMTAEMRDALRRRGYQREAVRNMTPAEAHEILSTPEAATGGKGDAGRDTGGRPAISGVYPVRDMAEKLAIARRDIKPGNVSMDDPAFAGLREVDFTPPAPAGGPAPPQYRPGVGTGPGIDLSPRPPPIPREMPGPRPGGFLGPQEPMAHAFGPNAVLAGKSQAAAPPKGGWLAGIGGQVARAAGAAGGFALGGKVGHPFAGAGIGRWLGGKLYDAAAGKGGALGPRLDGAMRAHVARAAETIENSAKGFAKLAPRITRALGSPPTPAAAVKDVSYDQQDKPKRSSTLRQTFDRLSTQVQRAAADIPGTMKRVHDALLAVRELDPKLADGAEQRIGAKMQFLATTLPPAPPMNGVGRPPAVRHSDAAMVDWLRGVAAVEDPIGRLNAEMKTGRVMPATVRAIREVHPEIFATVQRSIIENLADIRQNLPYHARLQLGILFEVPADSSLRPEFMASRQAMFHAEPGTEGGKRGPSADLGDIGSMATEPTQAQKLST